MVIDSLFQNPFYSNFHFPFTVIKAALLRNIIDKKFLSFFPPCLKERKEEV